MARPLSPAPAHRNVPVPFAADIPGGVFPGKAILVKGVVLNSTRGDDRFAIDLCCGKLVQGDHRDNKALHINPRFDGSAPLFCRPDRDIVLNTLVNNVWGGEQRCKNTLEKGKAFTIRVLILRDYFKISLDGKHLCDFVHRVPLESIKCIFVSGGVSIDLIEYQGTKPDSGIGGHETADLAAPVEVMKPDVPFVFQMPSGGFLPPREVLIILTPLLSATQFALNIFCSEEFLFHLRADFPDQNVAGDRGAVIRNNTCNGAWQKEDRQMGRFPFTPGVTSDVKLSAIPNGIKVVIDGSFFCEFAYRTAGPQPTESSQLTVVGDVSVQKFTLKNRQN